MQAASATSSHSLGNFISTTSFIMCHDICLWICNTREFQDVFSEERTCKQKQQDWGYFFLKGRPQINFSVWSMTCRTRLETISLEQNFLQVSSLVNLEALHYSVMTGTWWMPKRCFLSQWMTLRVVCLKLLPSTWAFILSIKVGVQWLSEINLVINTMIVIKTVLL